MDLKQPRQQWAALLAERRLELPSANATSFNAGWMMIDGNQWQRFDVTQRFVDWCAVNVRANNTMWSLGTQPPLNLALAGHMHFLESSFMVKPHASLDSNDTAPILHWTGPCKPWNLFFLDRLLDRIDSAKGSALQHWLHKTAKFAHVGEWQQYAAQCVPDNSAEAKEVDDIVRNVTRLFANKQAAHDASTCVVDAANPMLMVRRFKSLDTQEDEALARLHAMRNQRSHKYNAYCAQFDAIAVGMLRAAVRGAPLRKFVVLTAQRSGSRWLVSMLDSHPLLACDKELISAQRAQDAESIDDFVRLVDSELDKVASAAPAARSVCFKLMHNQGVDQFGALELVRALAAANVGVVALLRKDKLAQIVSQEANKLDKAAPLHGAAHAAHPTGESSAERVRAQKVTLDVDRLLARIERMNAYDDAVAEAAVSSHGRAITYEALVKDAQAEIDALAAWIGVPLAAVHSDYVAIHDQPLSNFVTNWHEAMAALRQFRDDKPFLKWIVGESD